MQRREDDVAAALLLRCGSVKTVWVRRCSSAGAAWERREGGMGAAWWGREGGVSAGCYVWGLRGSCVEAVLGQCEDGMGVMQGLHLR